MRLPVLLFSVALAAQDSLYLAAIAAASASLRLHDTAEAQRWLREAPVADRHWEWHYLNRLANQAEAVFQAHPQGVAALAFSPDGRLLATVSGDRTVRLFEAGTRRQIREFTGHTAAVWSVAFHPDGRRLVSGSSDGTVRIWSVASGEEVARHATGGRGITAVDWSADGTLIAASSWQVRPQKGVTGIVRLFDTATGAVRRELDFGVKPVTAIRFSPDSKAFAAATWDSWLGIWSVATAAEPKVAKIGDEAGTYPAFQSLAYQPDGARIAVAGKDGKVRLFDAATAELRQTISAHDQWANAVAWAPGGKWLASASSDQTLRLWSANRLLAALHAPTSALHALAVSPGGDRIATGGADGRVHIWSTEAAAPEHNRLRHGEVVYGLALTSDGGFVTAGWGGELKRWNAALTPAWTTKAHPSSANRVAISPDGRRLASTGNDGLLRITDAATGQLLQTWEDRPKGRGAAVAWSPDGKWVASPSDNATVKVRDAATGRARFTIDAGQGEPYDLAFSPDSRFLAIGWTGGELVLAHTATGAIATRLTGHQGAIRAVAFHPSGRQLAAAGDDRAIRIWNLPDGQLLHTLTGHAELIYGLDYHPDGRRLVSAATDASVRLWDPVGGRLILKIPFADQVYTARFTSDGHTLAVAPMNGSVELLRSRP